jgi:hypothetical protein
MASFEREALWNAPIRNTFQIGQDRRDLVSRSIKEAARLKYGSNIANTPGAAIFNRLNQFYRNPFSVSGMPITRKTSSVPFNPWSPSVKAY